MNGNLVSALDHYKDSTKYSGDIGSSTNPYCIADYADLRATNGLSGSFMLIDNIDLGEFNPVYNSGVKVTLTQGQDYFDFNGFYFYNFIVRTYNSDLYFLNIHLSVVSGQTAKYFIYKPYFRNFIFYNSYLRSNNPISFMRITQSGGNNYTTQLIIRDGKFEVYNNQNHSLYNNDNGGYTDHPVLFSNSDTNSYKPLFRFESCFLKLSGIEFCDDVSISDRLYANVLMNIANRTTSYGADIVDLTVFFNDYKIIGPVLKYGISCPYMPLFPVYFKKADTVNVIGKILITATEESYFEFFNSIMCIDPNGFNNILWNCSIEVIGDPSVLHLESYTTNFSNNKIFVNKDKIQSEIIDNGISSENYMMFTTEQLHDVDFLMENGMMLFDTDTDTITD